MISVEEALARVMALSQPLGAETMPLRRAAGRVLAADAVALRDQPPFAASAMDGYAIRKSDLHPDAQLRVVGEAAAGHGFDGDLGAGCAVRISTGAPVPLGADAVVIQEDVTREGDMIILGQALGTDTNIRPLGQDFLVGARVTSPRRIGPNDLALIAAMNVAEVQVARRPIVALIATGDELVMPGESPGPDQIIASNSFALAALAEAEGAEVRMLPIARDTEAALRFVFDLAQGADLIVTIGGASVGEHDLVGKVAADLGLDRAFYKVAMRPGKPLMAGRMQDAALLGLPGNPVSAIVCAHLFMLPMLRAMQGLAPAGRLQTAVLGCDLPANGARAHYMRARLDLSGGGPVIHPFDRQDSSLLSILSDARALLVRPADDPARRAGESVRFLPI